MPKLIVTDGPDAGRAHTLEGTRVTVGRGDRATFQLTDLTVSREHFRLMPHEGGWQLVDLGSRNRTLVNGEPVKLHALIDGDRIAVGGTHFVYAAGSSDSVVSGSTLSVRKVALENVTAELRGLQGAGREERHLAALYRFTEQLSAASDPADLYPRVARLSREECDAERALLFLRGADEDTLDCAARASDSDHDRVSVSRTVLDKVLGEGKSVLSADAHSDLRFAAQQSIVDNAIRSVMCAPVVSRGRTIGLLYVDIRREGRTFRDADLRFLTALAQQAGVAIENLQVRSALVAENSRLRAQVEADHDIVGESPAVQKVLRFIEKVAPTDATVMVNGESGTGKELVANGIHRSSPRADQPFVAINCAALSETLLESELFGHEKGAFTGATGQKKGHFELADGGTLFLDEVGELSMSCQTKFLRVLEEGTFQRVGGTRTHRTDVRVVAATNRDLAAMVAEGTFRNDLYYRLQVIQIELPPLRTRAGDVERLVRHFVSRYARKMGRRIEGVEPAAMKVMTGWRWPGNVRELKNAVERALVLGEGPLLRAEDLPPDMLRGDSPMLAATQAVEARSLKSLERDAIIAALQETDGNKVKAAALLEIDRSTLYKKIKDYDIST